MNIKTNRKKSDRNDGIERGGGKPFYIENILGNGGQQENGELKYGYQILF